MSRFAMETADVVLMGDDLEKLPFLIWHSKVMMRLIRSNISLSLGIKAAFLLLALFGWGTMLLATGNGIRLLKSELKMELIVTHCWSAMTTNKSKKVA